MPSPLALNLHHLRQQISDAVEKCGRTPGTVNLVAVSKSKPASAIKEIYEAGQTDFGENYVQEFTTKLKTLKELPLHWHFVGHLQRRKVRDVVGKVELIHSLDSLNLASEINKEAVKKKMVQKCLLQINLSGEKTKSGIGEEEAADFLKEAETLFSLGIVGLMTLPPLFDDAKAARPIFQKLRELKDRLNAEKIYSLSLTELSMGMSHDFRVAIEEGATIVRIGTAIFGERT